MSEDDELKVMSVPIYRKIHNVSSETVIGTDHFERWFAWFFEEPELEQLNDINELTDDEYPR
jgi:hypothetical protein